MLDHTHYDRGFKFSYLKTFISSIYHKKCNDIHFFIHLRYTVNNVKKLIMLKSDVNMVVKLASLYEFTSLESKNE